MVIDDEICKMRKKLDRSIEQSESYDKIYAISLELDKLIAEYYRIQERKKEEY